MPSNSQVDILYLASHGAGWAPVDRLVMLATEMLGANATRVEDRGEVSLARKLSSFVPRRRGKKGVLLVVASNPAQLAYAARVRHWLPGYEATAAWVIDSFWSQKISRFARHGGHFDHLFITDRDLVSEWRALTGSEVHWAPWGADTLAYPLQSGSRPIDLLRVGRQPPAWDDDTTVQADAASVGLRMQGRPPLGRTSGENQRTLDAALLSTKFVLAFHNGVSPASYTHPDRTYLTGRWMDALAAGATVVGAAPDAASYTLWPRATEEIDPNDVKGGLERVAALRAAWLPEDALRQQRLASATIDWRYRIGAIAEVLSLAKTEQLRHDLAELKSRSSPAITGG